jgi:tetratricopeptide (TPR) repeat protein
MGRSINSLKHHCLIVRRLSIVADMASVDIDTLIASARDLARAGRLEHAARLLDATRSSSPHEAGALAAARAEIEVDHAWWTRREADASRLDTARRLAVDDAQAWVVDFARLRSSYARQLYVKLAGGSPAADGLAPEADRLAEGAPDAAARAYARFYRGLIAAVLDDDEAAAERFWRAALDTDDEYVRSHALRHLGGIADDAGRHDEALELWRESTRLRQRAGYLPGVLAQLQLYPGDTTPDDIVTDWATALGMGELFRAGLTTEPEVARDPA